MPNPKPETLLKCLLVTNLLQVAESFGLSYPAFLRAAKKVSLLVTGTTLSEAQNSGLHWRIFAQTVFDTRFLHLWVLSFSNRTDFIIRLCQYCAIETVGLSFGHLNRGVGAITAGALRNFVAQELAPTISYDAKHIQKVLGIEKNAITLLAIIGKKGKSILPIVLKMMGGHQEEFIITTTLKPVDARTITFNQNCSIIIENMFKEHTLRRAFSSKTTNPTLLILPILNRTQKLNILPFLGYTIFGLTVTIGSVVAMLAIFQRSKTRHYSNYINIIDIESGSIHNFDY